MTRAGVGKTYLAAFDSKNYRTVLFVAHREEILRQAALSFRNVRGSDDYGFFDGNSKCTDKSVIFANVATLGQERYLTEKYFAPDRFSYLVIDEIHHGVTAQYQRIVRYFRPQFLLGLTATPDRMDGKDIYQICDYNVPYELSLKDAINRGVLVPFRYYGIFDDTDYTKLHLVRGRYDEKELNETYIGNVHRHELIYKNYLKYSARTHAAGSVGPVSGRTAPAISAAATVSTTYSGATSVSSSGKYSSGLSIGVSSGSVPSASRALGFCCSRAHAEEMAREFSKRGTPAAAVYSNADGEFSEDRTEAIRRLEAGEIRVIFSVDMFNEGVDIPDVDMVLFLRPTESPVVFLQQLGRGLRKARGKEYLTVLDFIGNYEKAGRVRYLLTGDNRPRTDTGTGTSGKTTTSGQSVSSASGLLNAEYPDDCLIDFDLQLIDLFREMDRKHTKVKDLIREEFLRVEAQLGHQPSRMELFTLMDDDIYDLCRRNSAENIFKNYLPFLESLGRLTSEEKELYGGPGRDFLHLLETTSMTKVYKMPVLRAFYHNGDVRMAVTEEELLTEWKTFFGSGANWRDLKPDGTYQDYLAISDKAHLSNILSNPVHFLQRSGKGFFISKEGYALAIREDLAEIVKRPVFAQQMGDIIDYRAMDYYQRRYHGNHA